MADGAENPTGIDRANAVIVLNTRPEKSAATRMSMSPPVIVIQMVLLLQHFFGQ